MNRDDIIRMARESGMRFHKEAPTEIEYFYVYPDALEHFANLIAAAERKAVLEMIDEFVGMERDRNTMFSDGHDYALHQVTEFVLARGQG
jgi:hypothetical protein